MGLHRHDRAGLMPTCPVSSCLPPVIETEYLQKPGFILLLPASCFLPAPPESCPRQDLITAAVPGKHRWEAPGVSQQGHSFPSLWSRDTTPRLRNAHSADPETIKRRAGCAKEMMSSSKESTRGCRGPIALSMDKGLILVELTVSKTPQRRQDSTHPFSLNGHRRCRKRRAHCCSSQKPAARWGWKRMHGPGGQKWGCRASREFQKTCLWLLAKAYLEESQQSRSSCS